MGQQDDRPSPEEEARSGAAGGAGTPRPDPAERDDVTLDSGAIGGSDLADRGGEGETDDTLLSLDPSDPDDRTLVSGPVARDDQASSWPRGGGPGAGTAFPPSRSLEPALVGGSATIGRYEILREIGRGGMGVVYLGFDPSLERRVAIKVLPIKVSGDEVVFRRFRQEARLLASLNHANIATIHSLEEDAGRHFLTMELVSGRTLSDRLTEGALSVGEWFLVARQITAALEAAHERGIVHLDLKPGNVMTSEEGQVKVLDFGLAMALGRRAAEDGEVRTAARRQEAISGTPGYMAPEQIQGRPVDSRADIWALGCVLYEAAVGTRAFEGAGVPELVRSTLTREPDLARIPADYPRVVTELVRGTLAKDVARRTPTVTEIGAQLEAALRAPVRPARPEVPNNLPRILSKFVGRTRQVEALRGRIVEQRLVTLTGVGGGGKTRLALETVREIQEEFPDGVWFIEITGVTAAAQLAQEVLAVVGIREQPGRDAHAVLVDHFRTRRALLLFDDCEADLEAVATLVQRLLQSGADLHVVATSRQPLGLAGESIFLVPSLSVPRGRRPGSLEELRANEAVQLFEERARAARPDFVVDESNAAAIHQICQRLDGIPLALELAAARIRALAPAAIAERLDDRFRLLTSSQRGTLARHQTLRALVDWSYDQLEAGERATFDRLSVFAGGFDLDAGEQVCTAPDVEAWELLDHIAGLVDKSLLELDAEEGERTGRTRYRMLQTIRAYAQERLVARGEAPEVRARHRDFYLRFAEQAEIDLVGPDQVRTLGLLAAEHDNFRIALEEQGDASDDLDLRLRLAGVLGRYWHIRGLWTEGRAAYARLLGGADLPRTTATAQALNWAGNLAKAQGDIVAARRYLEESLAIRRSLGDEVGIGASLQNLGNVAKDAGDLVLAENFYTESLAIQTRLANVAGIAANLNNLGLVAVMAGDLTAARRHFSESLTLRRERRELRDVAMCLNNLGWVAEAEGRIEDAVAHQEEALVMHRELGQSFGIATSLNNLANLAWKSQDLARAEATYREALGIVRELGDGRSQATILNNLGDVELARGDLASAEQRYREGLEILAALGDRATAAHLLRSLGQSAAQKGEARQAARLLGAAAALREEVGVTWTPDAQAKVEDTLRALEAAIGADAVTVERSAGAALSFAEMVRAAHGPSGP